MGFYRKLAGYLDRKVTVLVIPQTDLKPLRWQCTTAFFLFCFALWSSLTVWAGFIVSRHVDYWITKADNAVMMAKLNHIAQEMRRSQQVLAMAEDTDRQMRQLLNLAHRDDDLTGVGGPTAADRANLMITLNRASGLREADWHKQIQDIREESYKRLASFQEIAWYLSNQRSLFNATPGMWPTDGRITSPFGYRFNPIREYDGETGEFHSGIDIANRPDTLIYATADGTVRYAGWSHGYGNVIVIDHGYGMSTLYGHTSKALVKSGDHVRRGQVIAYMGTTGRSTGAHVHYEVWRNGKPVNPLIFLKVHSGDELLSDGGSPFQASGK